MTRGRLIKANKTPFQYFFELLGNIFFFLLLHLKLETESQKLLKPSQEYKGRV